MYNTSYIASYILNLSLQRTRSILSKMVKQEMIIAKGQIENIS